jgi:hypothetical protein
MFGGAALPRARSQLLAKQALPSWRGLPMAHQLTQEAALPSGRRLPAKKSVSIARLKKDRDSAVWAR